jgi:hypothetical protein
MNIITIIIIIINTNLVKNTQHSITFNKNVKFVNDTAPKSNIK